MVNYQLIVNLLLHGIILIFSCLSLVIAVSKARGHLSWLIPTVIGWGFMLFAGLLNLAFVIAFRQGGFSSSPLRGLLGVGQWVYLFGTGCLAWAAVALYGKLQSSVFAPQVAWGAGHGVPGIGDGQPSGEGSWPPPPTPPAV